MSKIIALSTCCLSHRHTEGDSMLKECADMGFSHVELSHGIRMSLVPGVLKAVESGVIKIRSVHNFCPLPTGVMVAAPNVYQPTVADERERNLWLKNTIRSIDFAEQVGAEVMVVHCGSVEMFWKRAIQKVIAARKEKPPETLDSDEEYQMLLSNALEKIRRKSAAPMMRLVDSLHRVLPYAHEKNIRLGLENRDGLRELPLDDGFPWLLDQIGHEEIVGYWHDTGHARRKQLFGIMDQEAQLEEMADDTLGFHFKDVSPEGRDDQPIGTGIVDMEMIASYVKPDHYVTLELGPQCKNEEIIASHEALKKLLG